MNFELPKTYPITDTRLSGMPHAEQVRRLISGGARIIQLRDKTATPSAFYAAAIESVRIARKHGVLILINDRVDVAMAAGADGVHLGQDDLPADTARRLLGEHAIIGLSTHSVDQAVEALKMPVDYIALGPIFVTDSKERPDPVTGPDMLRAVRSAIGSANLVGIGGIDEKNIRQVIDSGADSAAIISAILSDADEIEKRMRHFTTIS